MAATNSELKLASRLAAPFLRPGQGTRPLSYRLLPDGGMVVISSDGRKLWFTREEVNQVRAELGMSLLPPPPPPPQLTEEPTHLPFSSRPTGGSRDGKSEMIVLPPDLKHIEEKIHGRSDHS